MSGECKPPLSRVAAALRDTTDALVHEVATPGTRLPDWSEFHWRVAQAAAAIHGISPWLAAHSHWHGPPSWHAFLQQQREQTRIRNGRIAELLQSLDAMARHDHQCIVALKGAAMLPLSIYRDDERPMSDIDLLIRREQAEWLRGVLERLGYAQFGTGRRHTLFEHPHAAVPAGLGEVGDCPVRIEAHVRVAEHLPYAPVDITAGLWPLAAEPGLQGYASRAALMRHLLLHTAGNMSMRWLRMMQLVDLSRVSVSFDDDDWRALLESSDDPHALWWAYPPLWMMSRVLAAPVPEWLLALLRRRCPTALRTVTERRSVADFSGSHLWVGAMPALAWSRTPADAARYLWQRLRPDRTHMRQQADYVQRQPWAQSGSWYTRRQEWRVLRWLASRPPRPQVLYAVTQALTG